MGGKFSVDRVIISIHALRGEGDYLNDYLHGGDAIFQSTPSVGRATNKRTTEQARIDISIHALRGEGDRQTRYKHQTITCISIHALRGEGDEKGISS